jgi:hypothetical protein
MMLIRYIVVAIVVLALLAISLGVPEYLGRGALWLNLTTTSGEADRLAEFQDGYRRERDGDLRGALAKYRSAESSTLTPVQNAARSAIDRVNAKLRELGPMYDGLRTLAVWSAKLSVPLVAGGMLLLLLGAVSLAAPRSGTEIHRFAVVPEGEMGYSISFDRLLNAEVARIARAFQSDHLIRIGAAVTMSSPRADSELSGLETRAIAAVQQGDPKSILGFWLAEMVRRFQNIGFRPEYVISGTVVIGRDEAAASAQFIGVGRDRRVVVVDAVSTEAVKLRLPAPRAGVTPSAIPLPGPDPRQDARRLADLAMVLACKLFVCWMERELTKAAARSRSGESAGKTWPASWQTVHDYVSALTMLETAR